MHKKKEKNFYTFDNYMSLYRWISHYYQVREVLRLKPKEILEVGVGIGVFKSVIKELSNATYKNLDIQKYFEPDIVGSVEDIPIEDDTFDVVVAFQILEHLPFEKFNQSLSEISRVSRKNAIISLPQFGPQVRLYLKIPFFPEIKIHFKIPYPKLHKFNGEHYWEIGKRGYPKRKIRDAIEKHFIIKKEYMPFFGNMYHRFYVLEKK